MDAGVVQQFGTPDEVFDDPANLFVAQFVGEPQINVLRGVTKTVDGKVRVEIGSHAGGLDTVVSGVPDGTKVAVGVRPQDCAISADTAAGVTATVAYFEHLLEFGLATTTVAGIEEGIVVQTPAAEVYEPEQRVVVTAPPERVYLFDIESGERLR
jgi:multiple sugar transport system ATP-binding protein